MAVSIIYMQKEYLVELDDVRVSKNFQYADLACDPLNVCLLNDLLLLQSLNCHFLLSGQMHPESYLTEGALAEELACFETHIPIRYWLSEPRKNSSVPLVLILTSNNAG